MSKQDIEHRLLTVTRALLSELGTERAQYAAGLHASLDHDLGIGSLEKAELLHRIENEFNIQLPEGLLAKADSLSDFVTPITEANPKQAHVKSQHIQHNLKEAHFNPTHASTLADILTGYAKQEPNRPHIYLQDESGKEDIITYGDLYKSAKATARGLIKRKLKPGETVAIMLPTSKAFFSAFFGTLFAGGIPVPIYPPFRPNQIEEYTKREAAILKNAEVRILITFHRAAALSKILQGFIPSLHEVTTVDDLKSSWGLMPDIHIEAADSAMIQYTSGSTGDPKGVLLNHNNLLANIRTVGSSINIKPSDVAVSWLPLYHDMGLIGAWFNSLYHGIPITIMSPLSFITRPERWLWAIHYHRATLSAGPNFAYELCVTKIDDRDIEGLDLSSWRSAFNGAEAVYPRTIERFIKRFEPYGFKPEAMAPVYGLAESTVGLVVPELNRPPYIDKIDRNTFEEKQQAQPAKDNKSLLEFVACGKAMKDHKIRIADEENNALPDRHIGMIQFQGPSSMQGYYRNPKATNAIHHDGWWDTGDLGYMVDGELFITGRKKDVIIKAGRNLYPEAVEQATATVDGVRKGCVAAFGISDTRHGTEKFIVIAEAHKTDAETKRKIRANIIDKISASIGVPPDEVIIAPPKTIPKTSSGKLRRASCKKAYQEGKLTRRGLPVWLQIAKLYTQSFSKKITAILSMTGKLIYSAYIGILMLVTLPPLSVAIKVSSAFAGRKFMHYWSKLFLKLAGCPVSVKGKENLNKAWPLVITANHASYVDIVLLMAILPPEVAFVGKKEMEKMPIINNVVKKLNHLTIDRIDFSKSLSDIKNIKERINNGNSIVIFPEGTFTYATGLRPFKLGAFEVAANTKTSVCPIAIKGARNILRSDNFLPRPGKLYVTIGEPIKADGKTLTAVTMLRNQAQQFIAKHCGELAIERTTTSLLDKEIK